jgi:hypothetical protein
LELKEGKVSRAYIYIYILLKAKREEDSEQAQLGEPLRLCSLRLPHSLFGNKHAAALLFF